MKFNVRRTGDYHGINNPIETEHFKSIKEYDIHNTEEPFRRENAVYSIEIENLSELLKLIEELNEEVIIIKNKRNISYLYDYYDKPIYTAKYTIEIYDDWRE